MIIKLKRGYAVNVRSEERGKGKSIVILGNYSKSNYMGSIIVSKYGIAPTVRENHGQVTGVLVNDRGKRAQSN